MMVFLVFLVGPAWGQSPVKVNRTVPQVEAPRTTLEFSARPTAQEIIRARVFEEPLVPIGGEPTAEENSALTVALLGYAKRSGPDDFTSLTGFLEKHPQSPWRAALLTQLGMEYYNTAHYSLALSIWEEARSRATDAKDAKGGALVNRAVSELAYMYARLGRMTELEALLKSVEGPGAVGGGTVKMVGAHEGLWMMHNRPEVSFRCGPMALQSILTSDQRLLASCPNNAMMEIFNSASTTNGFSLSQVAELSKRIGLNYQIAFRENDGSFVVPSVVHWKVGHYAAIVQQVGDSYLVRDPTFGNTVWATRQALEAETSGYFLIPPGKLLPGWRRVTDQNAERVWGKGQTTDNDSDQITCRDLQTGTCPPQACHGMAASSVHLMVANLQIRDTPLGYTPPVGPPIEFTVRHNQRDPRVGSSGFGLNWTCDWFAWVEDNPYSPLADVKYQMGGGGARTFTGFNTNTHTFAFQQYDQTLLTRTGTNSYELLAPDGSKKIFAQPNGAIGTSRNIYLTQVLDPQGNAVTLTYDTNLLLVAITDAIGQVTTLSYGLSALTNGDVYVPADAYKITRVTDPFGRSATFNYMPVVTVEGIAGCPLSCSFGFAYSWWLASITDVIGMTSQVTNEAIAVLISLNGSGNGTILYRQLVTSMVTPYGTTTFLTGGGGMNGNTRYVETVYPDGSRDRVEYNQTVAVPTSDPLSSVPTGVLHQNIYLQYRNTFYWSRNACATGYGDYFKAKIYHWLHSSGLTTSSGILESTKAALEGRVWYDYPGQSSPLIAGTSSFPAHLGRVLDGGSTQLYTYAYDSFGHVTNSIDPVGRTFSYIYATNGIDLLEVRQTRAGNSELLTRMTYNAQHRPLTRIDAAGQTNTYTYNSRGQILTTTNPKGETITLTYDLNGYLVAMDGPLAGTNDVVKATYDAIGRVRTTTDVSGYVLTYDYDALDRLTRVTHLDSTFEQVTYDRLDSAIIQDRAGRQTIFEFNTMRQITKKTDPLGRVTLFDWCRCGALKSLTDPMGHTTSWLTDVQGRRIGKLYGDGSQVTYLYENTSSRVQQIIDEKLQSTTFSYNHDNTISSIGYANTSVPTPGVTFTYDPNYKRVSFRTDGTGTTLYSYHPITGNPILGAGRLASVDGPLPNDTITYGYDKLGRMVHRAINGVESAMAYDAAGRVAGATNALGAFAFAYDAGSRRPLSQSFPNGITESVSYGDRLHDFLLQQISYSAGATPVSQFSYGHDIARGRITTWSQQAGAQPPSIFNFGYDAANQLLAATVTNASTLLNTFAYGYDLAGNRLSEQAGGTNNNATYNALNQISTTTEPGASRTNEWDAANRLVAVNTGKQRTEFTYDGQSRMAGIRQLFNGIEVSHRLFVWDGSRICEERDTNGVVTRRFFGQGVRFETGANTGNFYYTRDHLGSIRELTDGNGNVRARYTYDPYGRRTKVSGDVDADFGFAGMFWSPEAQLSLTHFRAYDPELGRWLSRDPLTDAERREGPNLYAYVRNEPVNHKDLEGLGFTTADAWCEQHPVECAQLQAELGGLAVGGGAVVVNEIQQVGPEIEAVGGEAVECVQTAVGYAPGWSQNIATADTAQSFSEVAQQALPKADLILKAPDYDFVGLSYELPEIEYWVDENGEEILGDEAELLKANLGWANLYFKAAMDNLATGYQGAVQLGQIFRMMALLRGSSLP